MEEVYEEIIALYPKSRLEQLVVQALSTQTKSTSHFINMFHTRVLE